MEPGESRDFALGNVIAVTINVASKLRPTSQCHPDDYKASIIEERESKKREAVPASKKGAGNNAIKQQLREFAAASRILFESVRAREGFFVCELSNHSDRPAYVYIQLNKSGFYGGSGLAGAAIKIVAAFFRLSHFSMGN